MSTVLARGVGSPDPLTALTRRPWGERFGAPARLVPLALLVLLVAAPLLAVFSYLPQPSDGLFRHLYETVLGSYIRNTLLLSLGVALLTGLAGVGTAWLVTMYRFPGRRVFLWALVLPLAMPAYVLAYTYTDFLQVTGPLQSLLRDVTGWGVRDYWFPPIHSVGGAVFVLSAVLYPYVYVMARAAFVEQSQCAIEVSRTLGCTSLMAFCRVGLPLARPAIASGIAFAIMEAMADFGAVSFFGVPTFTTGIYRAWYALGSPAAASQLASLLLMFVFAVICFERLTRGRGRFSANTTHIFRKEQTQLTGAKGWLAMLACALPLLLGFLLPVGILAAMALDTTHWLTLERLALVTGNTLLLAGLASLVIVAVAMAALLAVSREPAPGATGLVRAATLGYAAPGAVIGVGIVVTVGALDGAVDGLARNLLGISTGLVLGGTVLALIYGYLTRFFAVAYSPLEAGFGKIGPALDDAARVLGCTRRSAFVRIILPLLRPSLLSALLLVFVDVMKELPATLILRPFNFDTLAVEAFRLATTERLAEAALPSFLIVLAGLLPVILLCRLLIRGRIGSGAVC
jgi:iron(III) transport system permease protein